MTELLVKRFVKNYQQTDLVQVRTAYGTLSSIVGIFCNVLLFGAKLFIGLLVNSISVMADAFNNLSDAASSIIGFVGVKMAEKPADDDHPFGHGRIEYIAAFIVAFIVIQVGFSLFKTSLNKILHPESMAFKWISILILALSVGVKRVILAAYSAGGVMALQAAITDSEHLIAGLLLSNTGPCAIGHGDPDLPKRIQEQWFSMELFEPFISRCFSRPVDPALKEKMIEYAREVDKETVYQASTTLREHDLRPDLPKISCPVMIAHGSLDKARTMEHVKMLTDGIADTEVFLLNGGHTIMVEDHDTWVEKLNYLIQKVGK
ncbi:MAG: alpha/beta fold hydrolase [Clostridium sp.]|nr:alpha/beta fold hydrolase [Clostridium sp.]